jgi:tRNA1(Val) A37 N6-methylase TrmN6
VTLKLRQPNRNLGSIYTPADFADLLSVWAITDKKQCILDLGVGEGAITFAAYRQLLALGTSKVDAQNQIYGSEIDPATYATFRKATKELNVKFPNIRQRDFFTSDFPEVDVVIGNPPYVGRSKINNYNVIKDAFSSWTELKENLSALTDLYVYFILQACTKLKEGGKLAVITSDSWLDARYGIVLKNYLKENFEVESLISLDRNIFHADVKALLTLATKRVPASGKTTRFARVKNGLPAEEILRISTTPTLRLADVELRSVSILNLSSSDSWGIQFKGSDIYNEVLAHKKITQVSEIADTKIGIQTLAKEFFVLSREKVLELELEKEFYRPLIQSNRNYSHPIIRKTSQPYHYLFYCDLAKTELQGAKVLGYIEQGEDTEVPVRGKNETVIGYQNKERIKASRRTPWYNLRTELQKRGKASILVPRIVSKYFRVYWNQARYIPGEFFIEFYPNNKEIKTEVYLAILSSSLFEMCLRIKSHLYGGGAYSVYPGQFKDIPIINPLLLEQKERQRLEAAYNKYLSNEIKGRRMIDKVILEILGWNAFSGEKINHKLNDLIKAVETFQRPH